jgi:hypothetical protein
MSLRIGRRLKFWLRVECGRRQISFGSKRRVGALLQEFESRGDAMRCLNKRGQIVWLASPEFCSWLNEEERDAREECRRIDELHNQHS